MRITIEIDGKAVEVLEAATPTLAHLDSEPPPELLAAAGRLGAQSAGIAAFSLPAGEVAAVGAVAPTALADEDAGPAPGLDSPRGAAAASKAKPRRSRVKR